MLAICLHEDLLAYFLNPSVVCGRCIFENNFDELSEVISPPWEFVIDALFIFNCIYNNTIYYYQISIKSIKK